MITENPLQTQPNAGGHQSYLKTNKLGLFSRIAIVRCYCNVSRYSLFQSISVLILSLLLKDQLRFVDLRLINCPCCLISASSFAQ